jgi:phasin family protein
MLNAEQALAAQKANVEFLFGLTKTAFDGAEKLMELNLQVAKAAMSEAADTAKAALSVKDAQELMAFQTSLLQPVAEKASAYSRHVYDIAMAAGAEVSKLAERGVARRAAHA